MGDKREKITRDIGRSEEVVNVLEKVLGPADQAWFVCSFDDCTHFAKGHCQIFTISNPPLTPAGLPCNNYEKRA